MLGNSCQLSRTLYTQDILLEFEFFLCPVQSQHEQRFTTSIIFKKAFFNSVSTLHETTAFTHRRPDIYYCSPKLSGLQLSTESYLAFALVLPYFAPWLASKTLRHFLNQSGANLKPIVPCSHAFSRAWRRLLVFASSSGWFVALFVSVLISQSNYFGLVLQDLTTLKWEPLHIRAVFNWVSKVVSRLLWFWFTRLYDWSAKFAPFSQPMGSQTKTNRAWWHAFSRALRKLHVCASRSDWLIVLFTSVVIGQSNYWFWFFNWKPL